MKISSSIGCDNFPCNDVVNECYLIPDMEIEPLNISIMMISEVPPQKSSDYFYARNNPFYMRTTLQAFHDAGLNVSSIQDILNLGIYITTAVKCGKIEYAISTDTITHCSKILEKEIALFPNLKVLMLMGDVAIKAMNYISKRQSNERVIPSSSTYKIRKKSYFFKNMRVFPSYILTGKNFLIEKSKRGMIAEDIRAAYKLLE